MLSLLLRDLGDGNGTPAADALPAVLSRIRSGRLIAAGDASEVDAWCSAIGAMLRTGKAGAPTGSQLVGARLVAETARQCTEPTFERYCEAWSAGLLPLLQQPAAGEDPATAPALLPSCLEAVAAQRSVGSQTYS